MFFVGWLLERKLRTTWGIRSKQNDIYRKIACIDETEIITEI